jgi:Protein of unknown function with HXXEE motif
MTIQLATWGLFVAWLAHDVEELVTMPHWARRNAGRLRARFPRVPERFWRAIDQTRPQVYLAVALVGVVMLAAAWDGGRTGGRSAFYQIVLVVFGLHGLVHLGQSALVRGYTPGVLTAPLIVLPFAGWAWWVLDRHGVGGHLTAGDVVLGLVLFPFVVAGALGLARLVVRR